MKEINNDAEKEKRAKKKDKAGLKKNRSRDVQNLEKGARTKEMTVLKEKNKLMGADKEYSMKCGLDVQTEEANAKTTGGSMPRCEQLPKKTSSRLGGKVSGRSRSGPWEVNKELRPRTGKMSAKLKKLGVEGTLVQTDTVAQAWKVRTLEKEERSAAGKSANIEKVPGTQKKVERSTLKGGKYRGVEKIPVEGRDSSMLQTGHASRDRKPLWKITPNTCGVCSAMATKRHYNAWACNACAVFFFNSGTSKVSRRPCMVNLHLKVQFHSSCVSVSLGTSATLEGAIGPSVRVADFSNAMKWYNHFFASFLAVQIHFFIHM